MDMDIHRCLSAREYAVMGSTQFYRDVVRYLIGGGVSLLLTLMAFFAVAQADWSLNALAITLLGLATLQMATQLVCFLHLSKARAQKWQSLSFIFTMLMLLIVVIGSLWIMRNLDYRMHISPQEAESYMREQNKKGF